MELRYFHVSRRENTKGAHLPKEGSNTTSTKSYLNKVYMDHTFLDSVKDQNFRVSCNPIYSFSPLSLTVAIGTAKVKGIKIVS